jgi:ABC-2 type transport system ATP-binding protein
MENILEIKNVEFTYKGKNPIHALKGVSIEIKKGGIYSLLGPNGAGKTTLVNNILGFLKPDKGEIVFKGKKLDPSDRNLISEIGFEPQENILWGTLKVKEHLELMGNLYEIERRTLKERIEFLLDSLKLKEKKNELVKKLSGGMKRRLQLAMAFLNSPSLLILDEPSSGLDPQSRRFLWDFLKKEKEKGKTILLTTHLMEEAQRVSDRIGIIDEGVLIEEGSVSEILEKHNSNSLEDVFIKITGKELRE